MSESPEQEKINVFTYIPPIRGWNTEHTHRLPTPRARALVLHGHSLSNAAARSCLWSAASRQRYPP